MTEPKVSIIVAIDDKRGIGKNNRLPWHIPEDLKRFRRLTSGHTIIMGRKTFESISRVLPGRTNIIITRNPQYQAEGALVVLSLDEAIEKAKEIDDQEVFIIGGGEIFKQALPITDKLYLTLIDAHANEADIFFPEYKEDFTKKTFEEEGVEGDLKYTWLDLERG